VQPFRLPSSLPVTAMKTYQIAAPLASHWNVVTCEDADCDAYRLGWASLIDERTDLGQRQAHYIRRESGRRFTEERQPDGLTAFSFEPGQKCFAEHKARNMRPERFVERGGDHRGTVGARREHGRPEDWVESFAENQDRLRSLAERG
jgi:hypothetical protein